MCGRWRAGGMSWACGRRLGPAQLLWVQTDDPVLVIAYCVKYNCPSGPSGSMCLWHLAAEDSSMVTPSPFGARRPMRWGRPALEMKRVALCLLRPSTGGRSRTSSACRSRSAPDAGKELAKRILPPSNWKAGALRKLQRSKKFCRTARSGAAAYS